MDNTNVTVQQTFNTMMSFLMAKFMINDVPHALDLEANVEPSMRRHISSIEGFLGLLNHQNNKEVCMIKADEHFS